MNLRLPRIPGRPYKASRGFKWTLAALAMLLCGFAAFLAFVWAWTSHVDPRERQESHSFYLVGSYSVQYWGAEGMGLYLGQQEVLGPEIVEVGWDARYLVASRRPIDGSTAAFSYYYIDRADNRVYGPFTEAEFETLRGEIPLPEFTEYYPGFP